jgi:hypothetical protein
MNFTSIGGGDFAAAFAALNGIEEAQIWNVARSAADIAGSFRYEIDPASSGLIAYWKFNEADASTTATDSVAGTYTGTLQGTPTATRVTATAPLVAPFLRRRPADAAAEEICARRRLAPIVAAVTPDNPQPRSRQRVVDPDIEEPKIRRRVLPIIPVVAPDDPQPRARQRIIDVVDEERQGRRRLAPIVAAVTPDNPPRASTARARMLADESRVEPEPRARKPLQRPAGLLSIVTDASTAAVDLTAIGTSDWRTWVGTAKPGDVIRKVSGANQISDWSPFNGSVASWTPGVEPAVVQWSDGDPVPVGSHSGILWTSGASKGFFWTVPASPQVRTLHLYLDVIAAGSYANISAFMSDGTSADTVVNTLVDGEWNVHITYSTPNPSATLTVYFVGGGASTEYRVRGLALEGPAVPNDIPFIRRLWQALASWDVEELRPRPRRAPILAAVTADDPPPRARARQVDATEEERSARRPRVPVAAPDAPPPRTLRRREDEPEDITGRRNRKLVPQPAAVVNNPPPRAGRSNWRVAWDSFEPVELLRKVYRLVFPGIDYPPPVPPLHIVENDVVRTIVDSTSTRSIVEIDTVREVSPMKTRKVGDTADVFSGTLYSGGAPRSLAGSSVKLYMWDSRTHTLKINGAVCLVEPSGTGTWSYQPIAADVDTAGEWEYDVEETLASGRLAVYPSSGYGKFVTEERVG